MIRPACIAPSLRQGFSVACVLALTACAGTPDTIDRYSAYQGMSCQELKAENDKAKAAIGTAKGAEVAETVGWTAGATAATILTAPLCMGCGGLAMAGLNAALDDDRTREPRQIEEATGTLYVAKNCDGIKPTTQKGAAR